MHQVNKLGDRKKMKDMRLRELKKQENGIGEKGKISNGIMEFYEVLDNTTQG